MEARKRKLGDQAANIVSNQQLPECSANNAACGSSKRAKHVNSIQTRRNKKTTLTATVVTKHVVDPQQRFVKVVIDTGDHQTEITAFERAQRERLIDLKIGRKYEFRNIFIESPKGKKGAQMTNQTMDLPKYKFFESSAVKDCGLGLLRITSASDLKKRARQEFVNIKGRVILVESDRKYKPRNVVASIWLEIENNHKTFIDIYGNDNIGLKVVPGDYIIAHHVAVHDLAVNEDIFVYMSACSKASFIEREAVVNSLSSFNQDVPMLKRNASFKR